jgi:hypothetical protein
VADEDRAAALRSKRGELGKQPGFPNSGFTKHGD